MLCSVAPCHLRALTNGTGAFFVLKQLALWFLRTYWSLSKLPQDLVKMWSPVLSRPQLI